MALLGTVFIALIFRMPPSDVSRLVFEILASFKQLHLWGWTLSVALSLGWFLHAKHQRRVLHSEIARIAEERTTAQEKLIGRQPSSKKK